MLSLSRLGLFAGALASLVACTAVSTDDSESTDEDLHLKPKDGENLGRLQVTTPAGWALPVNPSDDATSTYRNANVALNTQARLTEGTGIVTITSKFDTALSTSNVNIVKGNTTTFGLGSIKATYDATSTLKRDFGPTPQLTVFFTPPSGAEAQVYKLPVNGAAAGGNAPFWAGAPAKAVLAPPGGYRFSFGLPILDDTNKTLAGGENANLALTPSDKRGTIIVKKPARDLADAALNYHVAAQTQIIQRNRDNAALAYGEVPSYDQRNTPQPANVAIQPGSLTYAPQEGVISWAALPMKDDTTLKVFPFAASEGQMHYELVVSNVAQTIALTPGQTKTIQLERIEVDDVEVTKETGEVYNQRGTWQIFRQGPNNAWIPITARVDASNGAGTQQAYATNTGLDVFAGTYRVIISYTTAEGAKTQDQTVTVP